MDKVDKIMTIFNDLKMFITLIRVSYFDFNNKLKSEQNYFPLVTKADKSLKVEYGYLFIMSLLLQQIALVKLC